MKMPKIYAIIQQFKDNCRAQGWKTSENEDWIEFQRDYHNFVWARAISLPSFKKIVSNRKCVIREGLSYRVVEASYTAWLFSEPPSETFIKTIFEDPLLSERIALYDLSPLLEDKNVCVKLNKTDSAVFKEFERFLKDELKVTLKNFSLIFPVESFHQNGDIKELA